MQRRRAVACAIARGCKGKELDIMLAMSEDDDRSFIDPAFRAHSAPISRWAEAVWGGWIPRQTMERAITRAKKKLADARRPWAAVSGPAGATVATAARIGWRLQGAEVLIADNGKQFNLSLDPPIVIRDEVHKAVRRWRWRRIVDRHPQLELGDADGERALKPLKAVLRHKARDCGWGRAQQSALRSAIVNGQWPQVRLHAAGLVDDPACQYCLHTVSTLGSSAPAGSAIHRMIGCPLVASVVRGAIGCSWSQYRARRREARNALGIEGLDDGDDPFAVAPRAGVLHQEPRLQRHRGPHPSEGGRTVEVHDASNMTVVACDSGSINGNHLGDVFGNSTPMTAASSAGPNLGLAPHSGGGARRDGAGWGNRAGWTRTLIATAGCGARQAAQEVVDAMRRVRQRTANALAWTRAIIALPPTPELCGGGQEGTFEWKRRPPDDMAGVTMYTDGSLIDGDLGCPTIAWAFVAVNRAGEHVAEAHGLVPCWVTCINGAEAWALLMAASCALPGSCFVTDSMMCFNNLRRGPRHALHPRNRLARVWKRLHHIFDDVDDQALLRWMPSHSTAANLGSRLDSDGRPITRRDLDGNARADVLAKEMVHRHRAPLRHRAELAACSDVIIKLAKYVGWSTWAANNSPAPPRRDAVELTAAQRADRTRRRAAGVARRSPHRSAFRPDRSPILGGHTLHRKGGAWECTTCRRTTGMRARMAPERCEGLATRRWSQQEARALEAEGRTVVEGTSTHRRWVTDDIIWCSVCGSYAEQKAVGLAKVCKGPPPPAGSGRTTALARLRDGRHPKTGARLRGMAVPEPTEVGDGMQPQWSLLPALGPQSDGSSAQCVPRVPAADCRTQPIITTQRPDDGVAMRMAALRERVKQRAASVSLQGGNGSRDDVGMDDQSGGNVGHLPAAEAPQDEDHGPPPRKKGCFFVDTMGMSGGLDTGEIVVSSDARSGSSNDYMDSATTLWPPSTRQAHGVLLLPSGVEATQAADSHDGMLDDGGSDRGTLGSDKRRRTSSASGDLSITDASRGCSLLFNGEPCDQRREDGIDGRAEGSLREQQLANSANGGVSERRVRRRLWFKQVG